jgi:large subunit ribosomal protein L19
MSQQIIQHVESKYLKAKLPEFRVGDTVDVHVKIMEGNKTRIQVFNGVVIGRKGRGLTHTFTVRRIVNNEGVERVFMLHSPLVTKVEVKRRGKVRRAKLHYLRFRVGKARRLRELRTGGKGKKAAATTQCATEAASEREPEPVGA